MRKKTSFSADKKRIGNDSNRKRNYRIRTLIKWSKIILKRKQNYIKEVYNFRRKI